MKPQMPRYMRPLLQGLQERQLAPGLHNVVIRHDDWCAIWRGGVCNCNPEVDLPRGETDAGN